MSETNMEDVPNTEESMRSGKRLRILINPKNLPKPKTPEAKVPKKDELTVEERTKLNDYFFDQKAKSIKKARERKWI